MSFLMNLPVGTIPLFKVPIIVALTGIRSVALIPPHSELKEEAVSTQGAGRDYFVALVMRRGAYMNAVCRVATL